MAEHEDPPARPREVARRADLDGYIATVDRLEPDIHSVDPGAFYASAAISLKRIADALERKNTLDGAAMEPKSYCVCCDREVGRTMASLCTIAGCRQYPRAK